MVVILTEINAISTIMFMIWTKIQNIQGNFDQHVDISTESFELLTKMFEKSTEIVKIKPK